LARATIGVMKGAHPTHGFWEKLPKGLEFEAPPRVSAETCSHCGKPVLKSVGFLLRADQVYCGYVVRADDAHDRIHLEVTFGAFEPAALERNVSLAADYAFGPDAESPAAWFTDTSLLVDDEGAGQLVPASEAKEHPRAKDFWEVFDWLSMCDPVFHHGSIAMLDAGPPART
jgi:hypothetical protein